MDSYASNVTTRKSTNYDVHYSCLVHQCMHSCPARMRKGLSDRFVCLLSLSARKSPDDKIQAAKRVVSTTKLSKMVKNQLDLVENLRYGPLAVKIREILCLVSTTPINHTYSRPCAFCSCATTLPQRVWRIQHTGMANRGFMPTPSNQLCIAGVAYGKGKEIVDGAELERAGYVFYRALVFKQ